MTAKAAPEVVCGCGGRERAYATVCTGGQRGGAGTNGYKHTGMTRSTLAPFPFQKASSPSSLAMVVKAWGIERYLGLLTSRRIACSWNRIFTLSSGATEVLVMAPAPAPADSSLIMDGFPPPSWPCIARAGVASVQGTRCFSRPCDGPGRRKAQIFLLRRPTARRARTATGTDNSARARALRESKGSQPVRRG